MDYDEWRVELRCAGCGWSSLMNAASGAAWLARAGRLRPNSDATPDVLRELLLALAPQQACAACGATALSARLVADDFEWPTSRRCEACGKLIPPERLEVFPNAALCAACQGREEQGFSGATGEFCKRCGAPLVLRPGRGAGIRRYVLSCSGNPPCRGQARD